MKESVSKRIAATGLGLGLAFGATACDRPFTNSNDLKDCESEWRIQSSRVDSMAGEMTQLEIGRTMLVEAIHEVRGTDYSIIAEDAMPARYKIVARLLIGNESGYTNYDTSKTELDTPRELFCKDPNVFGIYKTPEFVGAEAALKAAGINIDTLE